MTSQNGRQCTEKVTTILLCLGDVPVFRFITGRFSRVPLISCFSIDPVPVAHLLPGLIHVDSILNPDSCWAGDLRRSTRIRSTQHGPCYWNILDSVQRHDISTCSHQLPHRKVYSLTNRVFSCHECISSYLGHDYLVLH
jgi:hypothetical protein